MSPLTHVDVEAKAELSEMGVRVTVTAPRIHIVVDVDVIEDDFEPRTLYAILEQLPQIVGQGVHGLVDRITDEKEETTP